MQKIPQQGIKLDEDYADLPCANTHLLLLMYDNFFKILGILYDKTNLRIEVLNHIRTNYTYYKRISYDLLKRKKLDLADWLASMLTKDLPADEI